MTLPPQASSKTDSVSPLSGFRPIASPSRRGAAWRWRNPARRRSPRSVSQSTPTPARLDQRLAADDDLLAVYQDRQNTAKGADRGNESSLRLSGTAAQLAMIGFKLVDRSVSDLIQADIVADQRLEDRGARRPSWLLSRGLQRLSSILWAGARLQKIATTEDQTSIRHQISRGGGYLCSFSTGSS